MRILSDQVRDGWDDLHCPLVFIYRVFTGPAAAGSCTPWSHQDIQQSCAGGEGRPDAPGATFEEFCLLLIRSILLRVSRGKYGVVGGSFSFHGVLRSWGLGGVGCSQEEGDGRQLDCGGAECQLLKE